MRPLLLPLLAALLSPALTAQPVVSTLSPYLGLDLDASAPLIGVATRLPLPGPFAVRPSVDLTLTEHDAYLQAEVDLVAGPQSGPVRPYVGAGVAWLAPVKGSGGDIAGALLAGVEVPWGSRFRPFAQVRYTAVDVIERWTAAGRVGATVQR